MSHSANEPWIFIYKELGTFKEAPTDKGVKRAINRQVQINTSRKRKATRKAALKGDCKLFYTNAASQPGYGRYRLQQTSDNAPKLGLSLANEPSRRIGATSIPDAYHGALPPSDRYLIGSLKAKRVLGSAIDPFNPSLSRCSNWLYAALDFWTRHWAQSVFKVEWENDPKQLLRQELISELVVGFISNKAHGFALSAAAHARLRLMGRENTCSKYGPAPSEEWLSFNAVRSTRLEMARYDAARELDPQLMHDIINLANNAMFKQQFEVARIHLSTFAQLLPPLKGEGQMKSYVRGLWTGDILVALSTLTPPRLAPWAPPLASSRLTVNSISPDVLERGIGEGLLPLATALGNTDSQKLATLIQAVVEWARYSHRIRQDLRPDGSAAKWLRQRAYYLLARLLAWPPLESASAAINPHFLEAVRLALILWLSHKTTHLAVLQAGRSALDQLKAALINIQSGLEHFERPNHHVIMPWILFIGAFMAEQTKHEQMWFDEHFLATFRATCYKSVERVLRRFFYSEEDHGKTFHRLHQTRGT